MLDSGDARMSFSGLKTAVMRARDRLVAAQGGLWRRDVADLCAGFQAAVAEVLAAKTAEAMAGFASRAGPEPLLAVAGGVAANTVLRGVLEDAATGAGFRLVAPPLRLCTDNGAMIAWAGAERLLAGIAPGPVVARPRWPLDEASAPLYGAGRKGAKA